MLESINRPCKKFWYLLLRVLSYLLIRFSSRIMIPSTRLNLWRSGCLKIMLMFCNGQFSPRIWIQLRTCGDFLKIQIHKRAPANINNLKTICQEEWYKIPTNYWKKLRTGRDQWLLKWIKDILQSIKWRWCIIFLYCTITFFHLWKWINGINFCQINCNSSLHTHISRIYTYTVNVDKHFVQSIWKKNFYMYKYLCI